VFLREYLVDGRAGCDHTGPPYEHWHAETALPSRAFFAVKRGDSAVRPRCSLRTVVGSIYDDRILGQLERVDLREETADHVVVLDHSVGVETDSRATDRLLLEMRPDVHASRVEPDEERLAVLGLLVDELLGGGVDLFVDRGHALDGERPCVFDLLAAFAVGIA